MSDTPAVPYDNTAIQNDSTDLQQRFDTLLDLAIEYLIQIDGEWGTGRLTAEQARREILDDIGIRIIKARFGL